MAGTRDSRPNQLNSLGPLRDFHDLCDLRFAFKKAKENLKPQGSQTKAQNSYLTGLKDQVTVAPPDFSSVVNPCAMKDSPKPAGL